MEYPSNQELMIFLGAFCIGLIVIALTEERPEVIIRYPTPKNAGLVTYLDRASNCYEYKPKEVECSYEHLRLRPVEMNFTRQTCAK
jgi:hypothetical protein